MADRIRMFRFCHQSHPNPPTYVYASSISACRDKCSVRGGVDALNGGTDLWSPQELRHGRVCTSCCHRGLSQKNMLLL